MTSTSYSNNAEFKHKDDCTLSFQVGGWSVWVVRYEFLKFYKSVLLMFVYIIKMVMCQVSRCQILRL